MENIDSFDFKRPEKQPSYVKVIGVGGGGLNAVNYTFTTGIEDTDFIVCDTDAQRLAESPVPEKILFDNRDEIIEPVRKVMLSNAKIVFIVAGLGGSTGTGYAPLIAQIAKSIEMGDDLFPNCIVVGVVTMPFNFEGSVRRHQAEEGLKELRKYVDTVLVIDNNKILEGEKLPFNQAFAKVDEVMCSAINCVTTLISRNAGMPVDFRDLQMVLKHGGEAFMGVGVGEGNMRDINAMLQAVTSPLTQNNDMSGADMVLVHFAFSKEHELTAEELNASTNYIEGVCVDYPTIFWGIGYDETLGGSLRVTILATRLLPMKKDSDDGIIRGLPRY